MYMRKLRSPRRRISSKRSSISKSPPALCTRVMPFALAHFIPARRAKSSSALVGLGTIFETSPEAASFKAPVASPVCGSRTIMPFGGLGVSRVMPASARAFELAQ